MLMDSKSGANMISILVLYLTFGVFSNALIYPTNQNTHSGGFAVRSNQQNDVMPSQCSQLFSKASKGLSEKYKCNNNREVAFEYSFSKCFSHCCYLKEYKDKLENEINQSNECPKIAILIQVLGINSILITADCDSNGCKCFQKFVDTFESNHKMVFNNNCPTGRCDNKTICCSKLEANQRFRDEMKNSNECESKVREKIIKDIDSFIYSSTKDLCPDCRFKVEKSNEMEVKSQCVESYKLKIKEIVAVISSKMRCGIDCSYTLKCCLLFETYKEIESQHKSKPIENCDQNLMNLFRKDWSESTELLLKHCSHCSSNVDSSVDSINRWYHSIGLVSIALTLIHQMFKL